jgi:predicted lipoprotein with Yx(FWY)xxD motif
MLLGFPSVSFGLYVLVASGGGVPAIDTQKTCRTSEQAIIAIFGDKTVATYDNCMEQEQAARKLIAKDWATFPAADKTLCAQAGAYMPSYVEWLTCFEMQAYIRKMRKEEQSAPKARSS